jgi:hypothetical protein
MRLPCQACLNYLFEGRLVDTLSLPNPPSIGLLEMGLPIFALLMAAFR